jgi:pilus assembly protein Flp/PilA
MFAYMRNIRRHRKDSRHRSDTGASAVEYGLLVAAIAAVIVVVVFALGNVLNSKFQDTCSKIASNGSTASPVPTECK